jgi:hypothetical protein
MERWQEQVEQKLAEFLRIIRSFGKMKEVWTDMSQNQPTDLPGHMAYAREKAHMYERMEYDARKKLEEMGYKHLLSMEGTIVDYIEAKRAEEVIFLMKSLGEGSSKFSICLFAL